MIYLDCERLKHPDTGLYHYCLNLGKALVDEARRRGEDDFGIYLHKRDRALFGQDVRCKTVGAFDRMALYDPRIDLWHTTTQLSSYQPLNGKKVLTIHDLNYLYEPLSQAQRDRRTKLVEKNMKRASAIVAISEFTKQDILRHLDVGNVPVEVIYNGCNVYSGPVTIPKDMPKGQFLFAVGTVLPKKNFHVLPNLLKGNDYELVIGGIFDSLEYRQRIIDEAKACGVEGRVHVIGSVPESEKHWYMEHCEAFLHPSIAEGFGLPVIEAMQYGKPVFISDHTSLPEVGGDKAYYFNHDFDPEMMRREFAEGMDDFRKGGKTPEAIINHARSFSWQEAAKHYMDLYHRVLDGRV